MTYDEVYVSSKQVVEFEFRHGDNNTPKLKLVATYGKDPAVPEDVRLIDVVRGWSVMIPADLLARVAERLDEIAPVLDEVIPTDA